MNLGQLPSAVSWDVIVPTAFLAAIVTLLATKFGEQLLRATTRPFVLLKERAYRWIAPRNPFSIALHSYRRHVLRSHLGRIENPIGPALDIPLERAFAPLKVISGTSEEGTELFSCAAETVRFIVLGGPGTGKTTLMKHLLANILRRRCHPSLDHLTPVFVVLRKLAAKQHTVEQAVVAAFDDHHFPGAQGFVKSALAEGKLMVILDGLDEVGLARDFVTAQIQEFCEMDDQREPRNRVIVTCRENSYKSEELRGVIPTVLRVEPFGNLHMRIFLRGWPVYHGRNAMMLFGMIQGDPKIRDICRNPLLLTILTGLYLETGDFELPSSRDRFYAASIAELLVHRPARRGISQEIGGDEKRQILERVSLERLEHAGKNDDPEELGGAAILAHAKDVLRRDFDENKLLTELVDINGIIKPGQSLF